MKCYLDEDNQPKAEVTVAGLDGKVEVAALIDTGFTGALSLSLPKAVAIGLKLLSVVQVELADGSIKGEYVFVGTVVMGRKKISVEILLNTSDESLLGTALLDTQRLTIDFPRRVVTITPSGYENKVE